MTTTIHLTAADAYRTENYGVLMESVTLHPTAGGRRGWHNPSHNHKVEVWENRPSKARDADPNVLVTPAGQPTEERYTYCLSAQATVLSAHPGETLQYGDDLTIGDTVELMVNGYSIGEFEIVARPLRDPELVKIG